MFLLESVSALPLGHMSIINRYNEGDGFLQVLGKYCK